MTVPTHSVPTNSSQSLPTLHREIRNLILPQSLFRSQSHVQDNEDDTKCCLLLSQSKCLQAYQKSLEQAVTKPFFNALPLVVCYCDLCPTPCNSQVLLLFHISKLGHALHNRLHRHCQSHRNNAEVCFHSISISSIIPSFS